ncbi:GroES-like protein [Colletotrichum caudatum]|nr:GroES-like protein [Colletotrichum caudatum]
MTSWLASYLGRHKNPSLGSHASLEEVPETQSLTSGYPIIRHNEVLVKTCIIGLNPIDWKAPDFDFAIPQSPYISGKELFGYVVEVGSSCSRLKLGNWVSKLLHSHPFLQPKLRRIMVISTDYRDPRKATYQEYVASLQFTTVRIPPSLSFEEAATLGVSFVTATLALGVCMGLTLSHVANGPDLLSIVHEAKVLLPLDVRGDCFDNMNRDTRARRGDWIAVWGGSATSAHLTIQLAKLAGLRVAVAVDSLKHGRRISNHESIKPDLLVDTYDPQRAVDIIRANYGESLRFGINTRGSESAAILLSAMSHNGSGSGEVPAVGEAIVHWLEKLHQRGLITCPDIIGVEEGLENVNKGLDRMRAGKISGRKLVVGLSQ